MLAGYARVSTLDQNPESQLDALRAAGCGRIFEDRASGARTDRPGLAEALDWMRKGDTLVVWRLDRLGRSLPQLVSTVRTPEGRAAGQADAGAAPPGRGDAEGHEGLSLRQRRDPQPPGRPHRVLPPLPEGADPGAQGLRAGKGAAMDIREFTGRSERGQAAGRAGEITKQVRSAARQ